MFNDMDTYTTRLYVRINYIAYIRVVLERHGWYNPGNKEEISFNTFTLTKLRRLIQLPSHINNINPKNSSKGRVSGTGMS